jgi:8-oxo-dGTP pyrophosphatase MutT (NUDIX family)
MPVWFGGWGSVAWPHFLCYLYGMGDILAGNGKPPFEEGEHFFEKGFEKAHTVVFFIDTKQYRIAMLKRAANLSFAPGLYTGVGGKIEKEEGHQRGAVRELGEELKEGEESFGKENIKEFGRIIINGHAVICYFALPYENDTLPETADSIGELEWISIDKIMDLDIIPTTKYFMKEWQKRNWDISKPFTVLMTRDDPNDINSIASSIVIEEGLVSEK